MRCMVACGMPTAPAAAAAAAAAAEVVGVKLLSVNTITMVGAGECCCLLLPAALAAVLSVLPKPLRYGS